MGRVGRAKLLWSVGCLLLSGLLFFLGVQRMRSALLLLEGNLAVAQKQFDSQAYEQAAQIWWTRDDHVLFNQGVRAFWAQDLQQAVQLFRKVSQTTADRRLHSKALYNSGVILMEMQQPEHLGNLAPARIPQYDRHGVFQGYMAHDGQILTTALNERTLHYLARETDGQYLRIQSGAELAKFFSAPETTTVASLHLGGHFQSFLFLALLSLAAMILCERGRPAIFRQPTRRQHLPARNLRQRWLLGEAPRHRQQ